MNVLSIDPSSSKSGVTLFLSDKVSSTNIWISNKKEDLGLRLFNYGRFLESVRAKSKLDYVAILQSNSNRNIKTVRMIAYFESASLLKAGEWNTPVYIINDKSARKKALGNGGLTKQQAYDILCKEYKLKEYDNGGSDQSDSITAGLACLEDHG